MTLGYEIFVALLLLGAAIAAWRFLRAKQEYFHSSTMYAVTRETDGAHAVMNFGMALMLTPWYGIALEWGLGMVFATLAAAFGILLWAKSTSRRSRRSNDGGVELGSYLYHFLASLVMLYAVVMMSNRAGMAMPDMDGMPGMQAPHSVLTYVLAAAFVVDLLATAVLVIWFPKLIGDVVGTYEPQSGSASALRQGGVESDTPRAGTIRLAALPHIIMDIGMVWMLTLG